MKYIKDVFKEYNPFLDNYGIKLYHVYEIKGFRFCIRYNKLSFTCSSDYNRYIRFCCQSNIGHMSDIYGGR